MGELYLEYIKGDCQNKNNTLCGFCAKFPSSAPGLARVPRPMPDQKALPELCYLPFDKTPTVTSSGSQRDVDDYQCGALLLSHKTFFTASSTNLPNIIAYSYDVKVSVELA